jgi:putative toxin-antitoxin system antitoxin component (TIGR02293 family)
MPATARSASARAKPSLPRLRAQLGLSQEALAQALGVSARTIVRWETQANIPSRLASERVERLVEVLHLGEQLFPGPALAVWFRTPNPTLGGRSPVDVIATRGGLDEIFHLLGRLAWGIPT